MIHGLVERGGFSAVQRAPSSSTRNHLICVKSLRTWHLTSRKLLRLLCDGYIALRVCGCRFEITDKQWRAEAPAAGPLGIKKQPPGRYKVSVKLEVWPARLVLPQWQQAVSCPDGWLYCLHHNDTDWSLQ